MIEIPEALIILTLDKSDILSLVRGFAPTPIHEDGEKLVRQGLMKNGGNQWNPEWNWDNDRLEQMKIDELAGLYYALKNNSLFND